MKFALLSSAAVLAILSSGTAFADEAVAPKSPIDDSKEIIVLGHGQSRQAQTLKNRDLLNAAPGTSALKVMDKLPGVSFQSSDPFGAYEWSTRITVRGFNQNQMGFTLDGITLGDMSYGNYNGLHVSRAIINEDIARIDMAQGAGSLDSATASNLGGTLKFISRDPSQKMGGEFAATLGSNNTHRLYGRFETGAINALGGLRGFVSLVDQKSTKWKGAGDQKAKQADVKFVLPIGEGSLTGFVNYSDRREQDYQDLSIAMINSPFYGHDWDNFQPNYTKAVGVGSVLNNTSLYLSGVLDPSSGYWTGLGTNPYLAYGVNTPDDSYYYGAGVRKDMLSGAKLDLPLSQTVRLNATVYGHKNEGQGLWVTPYTVSPNYGVVGATTNNAPLSVRTTEYDIDRKGLIASLNFDLGAHQVSAGLWTENNDFDQARRFYGETLSAPSRNSLDFQKNPFFTQWEYAFTTKTNHFYVQDVWAFSEALKINFGFKSLDVKSKVQSTHNPLTSGTAALAAELTSKDSFLPQVGFVYKMDKGMEVFGSYAENMIGFVSAATSGPFSSRNQANVDYIKNNLKPETSKTIEGGLRVRMPNFQGVIALYDVKFENRLLGVAQGPGIVGGAAVLSNVGGVDTQGLELAGTYRFTPEWKLYATYSYNNSEYRDNVVNAAGTILAATKGKAVVNTPKDLFKTELSYDNGALFATLGVNYTGARFYTYTNVGGKVPSTTLADLSLGYRFVKHNMDLQLNVSNLTDVKHISTIGSNGFTNTDAGNTSQTVLSGAPRQVFISLRKRF